MESRILREKFLEFFEERGHLIIPSSSLVPDDPTVLFTTAGMQQFTLHLQGLKDPVKDLGSRHLTSCQKCFRTDDIDEVGDDTHHTFFEMLGNWSIGQDPSSGYFKEGAINYALDFFVNELGLEKDRFWVTVFKGEKGVGKDEEARDIWRKNGVKSSRIKEFGFSDNFWGPVGKTGPCGPCSEIFYDRGVEFGCGGSGCGPNCNDCKRFVELWNLVFMEYFKDEQGNYKLLSQKNVDTGIGFERLVSLLQKKTSAYETDIFLPVIDELERISGKNYGGQKKIFRILADHIRSIVFIASEGILPSNLGQGYILRRLLRRIIRFGKLLNLPEDFMPVLVNKVIETYEEIYPKVRAEQENIIGVVREEQEKFEKTLEQGLKELHKIFEWWHQEDDSSAQPVSRKGMENMPGQERLKKARILGEKLFFLYQSYGFPLELSLDEFKNYFREEISPMLREEAKKTFEKDFEKHQTISRAGAEKKFGGIGRDADYEAVKLHTSTHLLHQALRQVLGSHVQQMGSDITSQRLRFDFSHSQRLTDEEVKKVEDLVNQKIKEDLTIKKEEVSYQEALDAGALAFFKDKYPEKVTVYSAVDSSGASFSKEVCGGPHVKRTGELGNFKIIKEKSAAAGIRRIKAVLK